MIKPSRVLVALAVGAASVGALATVASATTPPPTVVTLPVFGSPLIVTLTTNPDGTINNVDLNPATGWTANPPSLHHVKFTNADGSAKLTVRAKQGGQSTSVRVTNLDGLLGVGSWAGQVFDTGDNATVPYKIGKDASTPAKPTIMIDPPTGMSAGMSAVVDPGSSGSDDEGAWAAASVTFTKGAQVRVLRIRVSVESADDDHDDNGELSARLSISLGRSRLDPSKVAFNTPQTWNGMDCAGGALTATFQVAPDGTITVSVPTTGVTTKKHGVVVDFGNNVKLMISAKIDGSTLKFIRVTPKMHCRSTDPKPTTNVSIMPASDPGWSDHGGDNHQGGDKHHG